jgi:hypothetical protein
MREDKKVTGAVNFDDGRLLFELIDMDGVTHADIKCSSRKHGFQYKQMPAVELVCKVTQQMKQQERLEAYYKILSMVKETNNKL